MNIEKLIAENMKNAPLEDILDREDIHSLEWFWINRDIFADILKNIVEFDYYEKEDDITKFLDSIKDIEFIHLLLEEIEKKGFLEISQALFGKLDEDYRILEDIETWIFIKESYYNKLWTKKYNELEWVLRAMAINVYQRLDLPYTSLQETYRDLFENNSRILELLVDTGEVVLEGGKWILYELEGTLTFYLKGKIFYTWSQGEVEFKFEELQLP